MHTRHQTSAQLTHKLPLHRGHMALDSPSPDDPPWGSPDPTPQRWGVRETVTAVGVAAVIAALGGAAIYAATGHSHSSAQVFGHALSPGPPPGAGGQGPAGPPELPGSPPVVHGEFVVSDGVGGYTTTLTQSGTVTQISPTGITVRSTDDYTQTYVIPSGVAVARTIAADDEVQIRAKRTGQTVTITAVIQQSAPSGPGFSGPPPAHN